MIGTNEALLLLLLLLFFFNLFIIIIIIIYLFFFLFFLIIQSQAAFVYCLYVARFTIVHSNSFIIIYLFIFERLLPVCVTCIYTFKPFY